MLRVSSLSCALRDLRAGLRHLRDRHALHVLDDAAKRLRIGVHDLVDLRQRDQLRRVPIGMADIQNEPRQPGQRPLSANGSLPSASGTSIRSANTSASSASSMVPQRMVVIGLNAAELRGIADIKPEHRPKARPMPRGNGGVLTLGIGAQDRAGIVEQVGDHRADALAGTLRRQHQDRAFSIAVAQEPLADLADDQAALTQARRPGAACAWSPSGPSQTSAAATAPTKTPPNIGGASAMNPMHGQSSAPATTRSAKRVPSISPIQPMRKHQSASAVPNRTPLRSIDPP